LQNSEWGNGAAGDKKHKMARVGKLENLGVERNSK